MGGGWGWVSGEWGSAQGCGVGSEEDWAPDHLMPWGWVGRGVGGWGWISGDRCRRGGVRRACRCMAVRKVQVAGGPSSLTSSTPWRARSATW